MGTRASVCLKEHGKQCPCISKGMWEPFPKCVKVSAGNRATLYHRVCGKVCGMSKEFRVQCSSVSEETGNKPSGFPIKWDPILTEFNCVMCTYTKCFVRCIIWGWKKHSCIPLTQHTVFHWLMASVTELDEQSIQV